MFSALSQIQIKQSKTDLLAHIEYLSTTVRKGSVIFIVSDFITPPFEKALTKLLRIHDVCGVAVSPFEELPRRGIHSERDPAAWGTLECLQDLDLDLESQMQ